MMLDHLRDNAMSVTILGFFAFAWFGWAQEAPPGRWRLPLGLGAVVSIVIAITGGFLTWRQRSESSALDDSGAMTRFIIIFWIEVILIAVGNGLLAWRGQATWISSWTAFIVAIHFLPLGSVFNDGGFYALGVVATIVVIGAFVTAREQSIAPSALTGAGIGIVFAAFAAWYLWRVSSAW